MFGREHKNVLRDIERLDCSAGFRQLNFEPATYLDAQGKPRPMFEITKDGFTYTAFGYKGAKAGPFKEGYIRQYNEMEALLRQAPAEPAALPAPARTREVTAFLVAVLQEGLALDTLALLAYARHAGLTQCEAAGAAGFSRGQVQKLERRLAEVGVTFPTIQAGGRRKQLREWFQSLLAGEREALRT